MAKHESNWPQGAHRGPRAAMGRAALLAVFLFAAGCARGSEVKPGALKGVAAGYAAMRGDSIERFRAADVAFQGALVISPNSPETLTAYAEMELLWAEALAGDKGPQYAPPEFDFHFNRGRKAGGKCIEQWPDHPGTKRVQAALYRLQVPADRAAAIAVFAQPGAKLGPWELLHLAAAQQLPPADFAQARATLQRALQQEPKLQRARYLLAQIALRQQPAEAATATALLDALLADTPEHQGAQQLRAAIIDAAAAAGQDEPPEQP